MANEAPAAAPAKTAAPAVDPKAAPSTTNGTVPDPAATEVIKVNGKEVKVTPAQLRALAQKGYFADGQLKSVDVLKKSTSALIDSLKDPARALQTLVEAGIKPEDLLERILASNSSEATKEKLSEWVYKNVVETAKLTPAQLADRQKLSEYERLKAEDDKRKESEKQTKLTAQQQQIYNAVRNEVVNQVKADKTFPQVEGVIRQVIDTLRAINKKGAPITKETVTKAMEKVKKDFVLMQQAILDADDDAENLIARIGEARALKISKALIARLQKAGKKPAAKPEEGEEKTTEKIDRRLGRHASGYNLMKFE